MKCKRSSDGRSLDHWFGRQTQSVLSAAVLAAPEPGRNGQGPRKAKGFTPVGRERRAYETARARRIAQHIEAPRTREVILQAARVLLYPGMTLFVENLVTLIN